MWISECMLDTFDIDNHYVDYGSIWLSEVVRHFSAWWLSLWYFSIEESLLIEIDSFCVILIKRLVRKPFTTLHLHAYQAFKLQTNTGARSNTTMVTQNWPSRRTPWRKTVENSFWRCFCCNLPFERKPLKNTRRFITKLPNKSSKI